MCDTLLARALALLSLVPGAHLEQGGRLLHDPQQKIIDVVLQVPNLQLDLFQLGLTLSQLRRLLLGGRLLLLHVHLLLQQQGDQLHVGQVLVLRRAVRYLLLRWRE